MSEIHEHLEHAEHTAHGGHEGHGHDPFMARVAMTMAIIAAALAVIAVMGHRTHNTVLQLQGDANRFLTEAAAYKVQSSNTFTRYQFKRNRMEEQQRAITFAKLFPVNPGTEGLRDSEMKKWEAYITKNKTEEKDVKLDEATKFPAKNADGSENDTSGALIVTGKRYTQLAEEQEKNAEQKQEESEVMHHQADRLDWAHLATECGLVLCTVSVLTKGRPFWFLGIACAVAGIYLAFTATQMKGHAEHGAEHGEQSAEHAEHPADASGHPAASTEHAAGATEHAAEAKGNAERAPAH